MSEAARSRWPDARFEPQLNRQGTAGSASENPLAELARLVGQDDSFRNAFGSSRAPRPEPQRLNPDYAQFSEQPVECRMTGAPSRRGGSLRCRRAGLGLAAHIARRAGPTRRTRASTRPISTMPRKRRIGDYAAYDAAPSLEHTYDPQSYAAPPLDARSLGRAGRSCGAASRLRGAGPCRRKRPSRRARRGARWWFSRPCWC